MSDDGASTDVPLALQQDRYVTPTLRAKGPGRLRVHVEIAVEGWGLHLSGEIAAEKVAVTLEPLAQRFAALPQTAIVRLQLGVRGHIAARPADRDVLAEVLRRDGPTVRWTLTNGSGEAVASESCAAALQPWSTQFRVDRSGDMQLTLALVDSQGAVIDSQSWAFKATDPPVQLSVVVKGDDGAPKPLSEQRRSYSFLPRWCVSAPDLLVVARPSRSPFFKSHFRAHVQVGGVPAAFDDGSGEFRAAVAPGAVSCVGTLRPYGWSGTDPGEGLEIQVGETVAVPAYDELRPVPTILTGAGVLAVLAGLAVGARAAYRWRDRRVLERVGICVSAHGSDSCEPVALVGRDPDGNFSSELILCGESGEPPQLLRPSEVNGRPEIAHLRQHRDGSVSVTAQADLPGLGRAQTRRLSVNEPDLTLSPELMLHVEPPPVAHAG